MKRHAFLNSVFACAVLAQVVAPLAVPVALAETLPSTNAGSEAPNAAALPAWPRVVQVGSDRLELYQPQALSWDGTRFTGRAAFAIGPDQGTPNYGFASLSARGTSDDGSRSVVLSDIRIDRVDLPLASDRAAALRAVIARQLSGQPLSLPASDVQASLAALHQKMPVVANPVPRIVFADQLTILVPVSGDPAWRPVEGAEPFERAINTQALLLKDGTGGLHLEAGGSWYQASAIEGPWSATTAVPPALAAAAKAAQAQQPADPLLPATGKPISPPAALLVSTVPTELVQTDGHAQLAPVAGTNLITMVNADHAVFMDPASGQTYLLASGRWFKAANLSGPWSFVASKDLPADFAKISPQDPKANVLISVAGTPQAKEAAIAATIPQTAVVPRSTTATVSYDGAPRFAPVEGTALSYAVNSAQPVIQVNAGENYMVSNGVWFASPAPTGPWTVASSVPPAIYDIPPSSPVHYVTGVRVYASGPSGVTVGYTPAYMGVAVAPGGTVVYGTGYHYGGYVGSRWTPAPATYGVGAGFSFGAGGFGYGFSPGWSWGAGVGPHWGPYAGATPYGRGWGFANVGVTNIYGRWGGRASVGPGWSGVSVGVSAWSHGAWGGVGVGIGVGVGAVGARAAIGGFSAYGGHYMNSTVGNHFGSTINNFNHNTYNINSDNNNTTNSGNTIGSHNTSNTNTRQGGAEGQNTQRGAPGRDGMRGQNGENGENGQNGQNGQNSHFGQQHSPGDGAGGSQSQSGETGRSQNGQPQNAGGRQTGRPGEAGQSGPQSGHNGLQGGPGPQIPSGTQTGKSTEPGHAGTAGPQPAHGGLPGGPGPQIPSGDRGQGAGAGQAGRNGQPTGHDGLPGALGPQTPSGARPEGGERGSAQGARGDRPDGNQQPGDHQNADRPEAGRQETGREDTGRQEGDRQETGRQETGRQETGRQETNRQDGGQQDHRSGESGREGGGTEGGIRESGSRDSGGERGRAEGHGESGGTRESGGGHRSDRNAGSEHHARGGGHHGRRSSSALTACPVRHRLASFRVRG